MKIDKEAIRIVLASSSLAFVKYPECVALFNSMLLGSYLLPNRDDTSLLKLDSFEKFREHLREEIKEQSSGNNDHRDVIVASVNIRNFNEINRKNGYREGDVVLRTVSKAIQNQKSASSSCWASGDQFYLAFYGQSINHIESSMFTFANALAKTEKNINVTIGLAEHNWAPKESNFIEFDTEVVRNADLARLFGKKSGKQINRYIESYSKSSLEDLKLEQDLTHSIKKGEIVLLYQPKFDTRTLEIIGFEALCRWNHSTKGIISPNYFIQLSEECGFIHQLGDYVMEESIKTLQWLINAGYKEQTIAVNVSIAQLERESGKYITAKTKELIDKYNIPPAQLELEVTESLAMTNASSTIHCLKKLKKLGVKISLDDFGTGYSSLFHLKDMPVDQIKIDRGFIGDIGNRKGEYIIQKIVELANELKISVVAEGVEDNHQLQKIKELGCQSIQGFLLSKPIPKTKIIERLNDKAKVI